MIGIGNYRQLTHIIVDDVDVDLESLNKKIFSFESI